MVYKDKRDYEIEQKFRDLMDNVTVDFSVMYFGPDHTEYKIHICDPISSVNYHLVENRERVRSMENKELANFFDCITAYTARKLGEARYTKELLCPN